MGLERVLRDRGPSYYSGPLLQQTASEAELADAALGMRTRRAALLESHQQQQQRRRHQLQQLLLSPLLQQQQQQRPSEEAEEEGETTRPDWLRTMPMDFRIWETLLRNRTGGMDTTANHASTRSSSESSAEEVAGLEVEEEEVEQEEDRGDAETETEAAESSYIPGLRASASSLATILALHRMRRRRLFRQQMLHRERQLQQQQLQQRQQLEQLERHRGQVEQREGEDVGEVAALDPNGEQRFDHQPAIFSDPWFDNQEDTEDREAGTTTSITTTPPSWPVESSFPNMLEPLLAPTRSHPHPLVGVHSTSTQTPPTVSVSERALHAAAPMPPLFPVRHAATTLHPVTRVIPRRPPSLGTTTRDTADRMASWSDAELVEEVRRVRGMVEAAHAQGRVSTLLQLRLLHMQRLLQERVQVRMQSLADLRAEGSQEEEDASSSLSSLHH